jgi:hypothetical protein
MKDAGLRDAVRQGASTAQRLAAKFAAVAGSTAAADSTVAADAGNGSRN